MKNNHIVHYSGIKMKKVEKIGTIYILRAKKHNEEVGKFYELFYKKDNAERRMKKLKKIFPALEMDIQYYTTADRNMWFNDEFFARKTNAEIVKRLLGVKNEKEENISNK